METFVCLRCQEPKLLVAFRSDTRLAARKAHRATCRVCERAVKRAVQARYMRSLQPKAIAYLGGKCSTCGFDDHRALQIDHINNDGALERRTVHRASILRKILRGEPGYQVLCANCNWIKEYERRKAQERAG